MNASIPPPLLAQLSSLIEERMGLHFPQERWQDLERKIQAAAHELGLADATACAQWLVSRPLAEEQITLLADYLTVGETYFFREQALWEALQNHILPSLLAARWGKDQRLRFWSTACCTGEEPYSLAILLNQTLAHLQAWHTTILATDINPNFLHRATRGVYGAWSFRGVPPTIQQHYFRPTDDGRLALLPAIKQQVCFAQLNLAEDVYPSPATNTNTMDVILCRNILFYFTPERALWVVEHLYQSLVDGGWLIVSPVEAAYLADTPFVPVQLAGVTVFRKNPTQQQTAQEQVFATRTTRPTKVQLAVDRAEPQPRQSPSPIFIPELGVTPLPIAEIASFAEERSKGASVQSGEPPPAGESVPQHPAQARYEAAHRFYAEGQYARVIEALRPLQTTCPPPPDQDGREAALSLLARAYANLGQLSEAQRWCERAIQASPANPGLEYLLATILLEQGDIQEARQSLTRILTLDPNFVLAHVALATIARQQHDSQAAVRHLEEARRLLQRYPRGTLVPESDGMTAGGLIEVVTSMLRSEPGESNL